MKKYLMSFILIIGLFVAAYFSDDFHKMLPKMSSKIANPPDNIVHTAASPVGQEVLDLLDEMTISKENLFDLQQEVGFKVLLDALIKKENFSLAGGLIYWESQEYIKGIEVNEDDFRKQYQFIIENLSKHKDDILQHSYELSREIFIIELKVNGELANKSFAELQKSFPDELLDDDNCYELQLSIKLKRPLKKVKKIHALCLEQGKHPSSTFDVVEYMLEIGQVNKIKDFYLPVLKKQVNLPNYAELVKMFNLDGQSNGNN